VKTPDVEKDIGKVLDDLAGMLSVL